MRANSAGQEGAWQPVPLDDSPTLFPIDPPEFLKLAGVSAERLHDWTAAGWLSFDFDEAPRLEEFHLAEVHVVRGVLDSGLKAEAPREMLEALPRPYRYDLRHLCYNFHTRSWHSLPSRSMDEIEDDIRDRLMADIGGTVDEYIADLATEGDVDSLEELRDQLAAAIERARQSGDAAEAHDIKKA